MRMPADHPAGQALSVRRLTKCFGDRAAFEDVSFDVQSGEVFGLLGPNGAGKTTMVRTLGTLLAPTAGTAYVAGLPLGGDSGIEIRRRIAVMPESPGLYLRLSVLENLEVFAGLYEVPDARARIDESLEAVRLIDRRQDICGRLSKGLRQRVALARALLSRPQVLFLDEPTSGLDPIAARDVHALIERLRHGGATIVLTTHRLDEAERLCDRVAILSTTVRAIGTPRGLRERAFAATLVATTLDPLADPDGIFRSLPSVRRWSKGDGWSYELTVSDPTAAAPALTRALVAAGADVLSIRQVQHSLEDVYLSLVDDTGP